MKKIIIILLTIVCHKISVAQFLLPVDSFYSFIKGNSIFANKVKWDTIDTQFKQQIQIAKTIDDTMKCFTYDLKSINDVHSHMFMKIM